MSRYQELDDEFWCHIGQKELLEYDLELIIRHHKDGTPIVVSVDKGEVDSIWRLDSGAKFAPAGAVSIDLRRLLMWCPGVEKIFLDSQCIKGPQEHSAAVYTTDGLFRSGSYNCPAVVFDDGDTMTIGVSESYFERAPIMQPAVENPMEISPLKSVALPGWGDWS